MEDLEDGTYLGRYHTTLLGEHIVQVNAGSMGMSANTSHVPKMNPVAGSPWRIYSLDGPPCPGRTTASGPGVSGECPALKPQVFTIDVRDKYGNKCQRYDPAKHTVEVRGG